MKKTVRFKSESKKKRGLKSWQRGLFAETIAATVLKVKGYKINEMRYKTPVGEIDLIAQKRDTLVFVEVKLRQTHDLALESIQYHQKKRIIQAANYYLASSTHKRSHTLRFDVITLNRFLGTKHLKNSWDEMGN